MKKSLFLLGTLALIVAGGIFWSCQKDEITTNPDEGLMLKKGKAEISGLETNAYSPEFEYSEGICEIECINPDEPIYWEMAGEKIFINNPANANNPNSKTINYVVYNTENSFIVKLIYSRSNGSNNPEVKVTVDGESQTKILNFGQEMIFDFPIEIVACKEIAWSFEETDYDLSTALEYSDKYSLVGVCEDECDESFAYVENIDGSYTFTYVPAEDMNGAEIKLTCPQIDGYISNDDKEYNSNPGQINGTDNVLTWTGDIKACKPVTFKLTFTPHCTLKENAEKWNSPNIWTDFKVNGESKKTVTPPNETTEWPTIVYSDCGE